METNRCSNNRGNNYDLGSAVTTCELARGVKQPTDTWAYQQQLNNLTTPLAPEAVFNLLATVSVVVVRGFVRYSEPVAVLEDATVL